MPWLESVALFVSSTASLMEVCCCAILGIAWDIEELFHCSHVADMLGVCYTFLVISFVLPWCYSYFTFGVWYMTSSNFS